MVQIEADYYLLPAPSLCQKFGSYHPHPYLSNLTTLRNSDNNRVFIITHGPPVQEPKNGPTNPCHTLIWTFNHGVMQRV